MQRLIKYHLTHYNYVLELNSMPCRPIKQRVIFPELSTNELVSTNQLSVQPDLSDHPLGYIYTHTKHILFIVN